MYTRHQSKTKLKHASVLYLVVGGFYSEVALQKREGEGTVRARRRRRRPLRGGMGGGKKQNGRWVTPPKRPTGAGWGGDKGAGGPNAG